LRQTRRLQCLDALPEQPKDGAPGALYLYDGQISALITGLDNWRYEATFLADVFFDRSLSMKRIDEYTIDDCRPDPLIKGQGISDPGPVKDSHTPLHYFLEISETWVDHVEKEWETIVEELAAKVETKYVTPDALPNQGGVRIPALFGLPTTMMDLANLWPG